MAAIHSSRSMRSSFFQLPSHLRAAVFNYATSSSRSFSSTARKDIDPVSILTAPPLLLMDSLHAIGLTWATVIPCTALILRGGITYHFFMKPQRKMHQQSAAIVPLIHAYTIMYRDQPEVQKKIKSMAYANSQVAGNLYMLYVRWKASMSGWWKLGHLTGQGRWRFFGSPVANFGILITAMEALRIKCGGREGLLSLVLYPITKVTEGRSTRYDPSALGHGPPIPDASTATSAAVMTSGAASEPLNQVQPSSNSLDYITHPEPALPVSPQSIDSVAATGPSSWLADPALQTEGLWFCPDLTAIDPTGTLPIAGFAALAIPAILSPQKARPNLPTSYSSQPSSESDTNNPYSALQQKAPSRTKWEMLTGASKFRLLFALYFWYVSQIMPAGMVLYMISSFTIGFVQRVWLDVRYPTVRPIEPCLRPVRQRRRGISW